MWNRIAFFLLFLVFLQGGLGNVYAQENQSSSFWAPSYLGKELPMIQLQQWWQSKSPDLNNAVPILMVFWTPTSTESTILLETLNEWQNALSGQLVIVAIAGARARAVKSKLPNNLSYYIGIDAKQQMQTNMRISGLPYAVLTDAHKKIIWEGYPFAHHHVLNVRVIKELLQL